MSEVLHQEVPLVALTPEYFFSRLAEANQIADQNERYKALEAEPIFIGSDVDDFRLLGEEGLYHEQTDTLSELAIKDNTPYELIPGACDEKEAELQEAAARLKALSDVEDERKTRLLAAAKRVAELAPSTSDAAAQLAKEKIASLKDLNREGLRQRIVELTSELGVLREALQISQTPWPAPLATRDIYLGSKNEVPEPDFYIIDEIPLEPETCEPGEPDGSTSREFHGTTNKASMMLTNYLARHPDIIFTPQQLGAYLYTDPSHFAGMQDAERDRCISQRIHRLLNQHELVAPALAELGYRLQYGYRHFIDSKTDQAIQRKRRIYRAVSQTSNPNAPTTFEETVDPSLQPEVILPPVYHRPVCPTEGEPLPIETLDPREAALVNYTNELIEQLWMLKILPEEPDGKVSIRRLQTAIIGMSWRDKRVSAVKLLKRNLEGASSDYKATPCEVTLWSYDKSYLPRKHRPREYRELETLVSSLLEMFYESLTV